jgi:hypothetical protein
VVLCWCDFTSGRLKSSALMRSKYRLSSRKMGPIGTIVGAIVGLLTLLGYLTGGFDRVYHYFADGIRIVIREEGFRFFHRY